MAIRSVQTLYFSATGTTRLMATTLGHSFAQALQCPLSGHRDITPLASRQEPIDFDSQTLVVVGSPVYAGRVPNKIMPFFRDRIKGHDTPCVVVLTYGNRAYDNALSEMLQLLSANGFIVAGAITQPSQHTFSNLLATGRPDDEDLARAERYASLLSRRLQSGHIGHCLPIPSGELAYYTPLTAQGTKANILKVKPQTDLERCNHCGLCAEGCPMGSISHAEPWKVEGICIKCHACVKHCPRQAKQFTDPEFLSHTAMILQNFTSHKEAEYYPDLGTTL